MLPIQPFRSQRNCRLRSRSFHPVFLSYEDLMVGKSARIRIRPISRAVYDKLYRIEVTSANKSALSSKTPSIAFNDHHDRPEHPRRLHTNRMNLRQHQATRENKGLGAKPTSQLDYRAARLLDPGRANQAALLLRTSTLSSANWTWLACKARLAAMYWTLRKIRCRAMANVIGSDISHAYTVAAKTGG